MWLGVLKGECAACKFCWTKKYWNYPHPTIKNQVLFVQTNQKKLRQTAILVILKKMHLDSVGN